jgi:hypothetical protein
VKGTQKLFLVRSVCLAGGIFGRWLKIQHQPDGNETGEAFWKRIGWRERRQPGDRCSGLLLLDRVDLRQRHHEQGHVGRHTAERKRKRAAALQDASRIPENIRIPTGLGVRLPSAAFSRAKEARKPKTDRSAARHGARSPVRSNSRMHSEPRFLLRAVVMLLTLLRTEVRAPSHSVDGFSE